MIKNPSNWKLVKNDMFKFQTAWTHRIVPLYVLGSISTLHDGSKWIHLSLSHPSRIPSWTELSKVKDEFLGPEVEAYQVLAKKSEHVNVCEKCLHLWAPLDGVRRVANLQDIVDEVAILVN